jgi:hypothetical protein
MAFSDSIRQLSPTCANLTKPQVRDARHCIGGSPASGHLRKHRYVLHDRDTKFCASFQAMLATGNVNCIALPPRRPNLNAFAERWVRSVKQECLSRLILFGEGFGASDSLLGLHQETEAAFDREVPVPGGSQRAPRGLTLFDLPPKDRLVKFAFR